MVTPVSRQRHKLSRETGGGRSLPSQIAQQFRDKIERGEWRVGGPLPTTRQLAKDYRVSLNTVQSAFRELQASDLIERVPRRGGFVKARSSDIVAAARARQGTLVGIVTPFPPEASEEQGDDWSKRITHAAEGMLLEKGLHLSMFSYPLGDSDPAGHILARVDQMGPDLAGMICFARPAIAGLTDELDRRSIPWVSINRAAEQAQHNFVTASNFHGGRTVGRCFARLGYERVAVLCNRMEPGSSSGDKFFGFIQGYLESGKLSIIFRVTTSPVQVGTTRSENISTSTVSRRASLRQAIIWRSEPCDCAASAALRYRRKSAWSGQRAFMWPRMHIRR
jgi:DNA-binding LacI/PurR family transcriptional regulator